MRGLSVLLLAVMTGCAPQLDDCSSDDDCPSGRICLDTFCLPPDASPPGDSMVEPADARPIDASLDSAVIGDMARPDAARDGEILDGSVADAGPLDAAPLDRGGDMAPDAAPDMAMPRCAPEHTEGAECYTGDPAEIGAQTTCRRGLWACVNQVWICEGEQRAGVEICDRNALDEDCDGVVDEQDAMVGCQAGEGACQTRGVMACDPATGMVACDAVPRPPADEEACVAGMVIDDDCDGTVDEGCECNDGEPLRACGPDVGACRPGTQACVNGMLQACEGAIGPANEICDSVDNDCDGDTDEGFRVNEFCETGVGLCRTNGRWACAPDGRAVCAAIAPEPMLEVCDGLDNDCDGNTDEASGDPEQCVVGEGACRNVGLIVCRNQRAVCSVEQRPGSDEICDGVDNDCDGAADEAISGLTASGNPLAVATRGQANPTAFAIARNSGSSLILTHVRGAEGPQASLSVIVTSDGQGRPMVGPLGNGTVDLWDVGVIGEQFVIGGVRGVIDVAPEVVVSYYAGAPEEAQIPRTMIVTPIDHLRVISRPDAAANDNDAIVLTRPTADPQVHRLQLSGDFEPQTTRIGTPGLRPASGFDGAVRGQDTFLTYQGLQQARFLRHDGQQVRLNAETDMDADRTATVDLGARGVIVAGRVAGAAGVGQDIALRNMASQVTARIEGVAVDRPALARTNDNFVVAWRTTAGTARLAIYTPSLLPLQVVDLGQAIEGPVVAAYDHRVSVAWVDANNQIRLQRLTTTCSP